MIKPIKWIFYQKMMCENVRKTEKMKEKRRLNFLYKRFDYKKVFKNKITTDTSAKHTSVAIVNKLRINLT